MIKSRPEYRVAFWKYQSAALSFEQARKVCVRLLETDSKEEQYFWLMISLHVLYVRPFNQEKESRRISDNIIPATFQGMHSLLIRLRDKVYAHHDKISGVNDPISGEDLSQVCMSFNRGKPAGFLNWVCPSREQIKEITLLLDFLICHCHEKSDEYLLKCLKHKNIPDGIYRVSTDFSKNAPLLEKFKALEFK